MGTGHVMRMLALAQAWAAEGGHARFLGRIESEPLRARISAEGFGLAPLDAAHPAPADLTALLAQSTPDCWVALDGYHFDTGYQRAIRRAGRKSLVVDDICDRGAYDANIYLNQNLAAETLRPEFNPEALTLVGPRYALLRREFQTQRPPHEPCRERARNILISFGGADPDNVTSQALQALVRMADPDLHIAVVAGPANPHVESLRTLAASLPSQHQFLHAVTDMSKLMAWADLAVSAAGSTCWELCCFGVPMLLVPIADNQADIGPALVQAGAAALSLPDPKALAQNICNLVDDASIRRLMRIAGRNLVDGGGAQRVVQALREAG